MANYRNSGFRQSGQGNNWNSNNGGNNYQRNNNQQNQTFKKSGAVYSRIKDGKMEGMMAVNAWRKTKNGLMTASAFPVDQTEHIGEKSKNTFIRYAVEVRNMDLGTSQTYWCLMQKESKKITIKELGLVISPNGNGVTASGKRVTGYFGKIFG